MTEPRKLVPFRERSDAELRAECEAALLRAKEAELDRLQELALCNCPECKCERFWLAHQEGTKRAKRREKIKDAFLLAVALGLIILFAWAIVGTKP
jgi:hypothetical protein